MKTPKQSKPYHVNYLQGFWYAYARDTIKGATNTIRHINRPSLGRFLRPAPRVRIEWIVIAFLLAIVLSGARANIIPEGVALAKVPPQIKPIAQTHLQATQTALEPIPVPAPTPPPQPAYVAPVSAVANCGSDPMMAYIYMVESGCRTWAVNPGGCIGLGQACPGGKLPCGLYDWTCQDNWFRSYAVSAYGSIYNAYIFRQAHNWW